MDASKIKKKQKQKQKQYIYMVMVTRVVNTEVATRGVL